ncbi:MAG TPA: DNA polymerase III subunit chi, partial [Candidatus Defluviicoccus seviourii]|nr:DNA polymerase III subunit chi [Candidatus Defluviicoccus seviourii]
MTEVAFYHLQAAPLDQVLPRLLEKTLAAGKRAVVIAGSRARAEALATVLWTYRPDSWLP